MTASHTSRPGARTRLHAALVLALAMVLVGLAPPAFAALSQVGLVSVTAASPTSLTLSWPAVSRATAYEVYRSTDVVNLTNNVKVTKVSGTSATVTGLAPGTTYCFQVRALNGSEVGSRSRRSCKPTIRSEGRGTGPMYVVMTFNVCSEVCPDWTTRRAAADNILTSQRPDVVASQEAGAWRAPAGYTQAVEKSAKRLFYKTSRFTLAPGRTGSVAMSTNRWAVWAELVDIATGQRAIFVSAHTSPASADYELRRQEVTALLNRMAQVNTAGLPVVYAGDFNSNKNRGAYDPATGFGAQDTVGLTFAKAGFYDGYDLARTAKRPNWNSFHGFGTTPKISYTWGDHVDHVYVQPSRTRVPRWTNSAPFSGSLYKTPMASDHSPVVVDVVLD